MNITICVFFPYLPTEHEKNKGDIFYKKQICIPYSHAISNALTIVIADIRKSLEFITPQLQS
jgi:hypothetical protein